MFFIMKKQDQTSNDFQVAQLDQRLEMAAWDSCTSDGPGDLDCDIEL